MESAVQVFITELLSNPTIHGLLLLLQSILQLYLLLKSLNILFCILLSLLHIKLLLVHIYVHMLYYAIHVLCFPQWACLSDTRLIMLAFKQCCRTLTEVLLIACESRRAASVSRSGVRAGLWVQGVNRALGNRVWWLWWLVPITDEDLCVLREAEVSAVVVYALHAPFTGVRNKGTLVNICSQTRRNLLLLSALVHILKDGNWQKHDSRP